MKAESVGTITPVVLVTLSPGEKILSAHGMMLYKEAPVKIHRRTLKSLGVSTLHLLSIRSKAGSEEDYFFAEYEGPGHVTFSRDKSGEVRTLQLQQGQKVRLRAGHIICFDETVKYNPIVLAQYQNPVDQKETEYVIADELTGPGTVVFQSVGNIISFQLGANEGLKTSIEAILLLADTVRIQMGWLMAAQAGITGSAAIPVVHVWGPGQVMLHSGL
jgi:uncharacterized protein (AIM24 family)